MNKLISAQQAAAHIRDGDVVSVSSSSGLGCPDKVLQAIGERFASEGAPRGLTTLHPIAADDMYGIKGIDHIAKPGLLTRVLAGSYPSGPSSLPMPAIWRMIVDNQLAAYNLPSGILYDMHRDAAARRPGVLTKVQDDLRFSDTKAGVLATAFVLAGVLCTLPSGYLADRKPEPAMRRFARRRRGGHALMIHHTAQGFHLTRAIPGKTLSRCGRGMRRFQVCPRAC